MIDDGMDLRRRQLVGHTDGWHCGISLLFARGVAFHDDRQDAAGIIIGDDGAALEWRKRAFQSLAIGLVASLTVGGIEGGSVGNAGSGSRCCWCGFIAGSSRIKKSR